jgi:LysR family cys regulon transcriptional activator
MIPDIPFYKLKTFYYVAINKSFKKAALDLYVTDGAVSQQVKDLEQRLGRRLLERSSQKTFLTPDGVNLFNLIAPVVEKLENLIPEFEKASGRLSGKIRVASSGAILLHLFPPYVKKFKRKYPECEILLFSVPGQQVFSMILGGQVDFGIGSVENIPDGIVGNERWLFKRYFIAPLGHPLSKKKHLTIEKIAQYPIVMADRTSKSVQRLYDELRVYNPDPKITVEAGDWEVVLKYVEMGFGVSTVPGIIIQPKDRKRLFIIDLRRIDESANMSRYGILVKKGKYLSPVARELISFLSPNFDFDALK